MGNRLIQSNICVGGKCLNFVSSRFRCVVQGLIIIRLRGRPPNGLESGGKPCGLSDVDTKGRAVYYQDITTKRFPRS